MIETPSGPYSENTYHYAQQLLTKHNDILGRLACVEAPDGVLWSNAVLDIQHLHMGNMMDGSFLHAFNHSTILPVLRSTLRAVKAHDDKEEEPFPDDYAERNLNFFAPRDLQPLEPGAVKSFLRCLERVASFVEQDSGLFNNPLMCIRKHGESLYSQLFDPILTEQQSCEQAMEFLKSVR